MATSHPLMNTSYDHFGQRQCPLVIHSELEPLTLPKLRTMLESGKDSDIYAAVKVILQMAYDGSNIIPLLMPLIQHAVPSENHLVQKTLLTLWPMVDLLDTTTGEMRPEFILVCEAYRDLMTGHNEFVAATAVRALAVMPLDVVQQTVESVEALLASRHDFLRSAVVVALHATYRRAPELVPEAPARVLGHLVTEAAPAVVRRGLTFLAQCAPELAQTALGSCRALGEQATNPDIALAFFTAARAVARLPGVPLDALVDKLIALAPTDSTSSSGIHTPAILFELAATLPLVSSRPDALACATSVWVHLISVAVDDRIISTAIDAIDAIFAVCPSAVSFDDAAVSFAAVHTRSHALCIRTLSLINQVSLTADAAKLTGLLAGDIIILAGELEAAIKADDVDVVSQIAALVGDEFNVMARFAAVENTLENNVELLNSYTEAAKAILVIAGQKPAPTAALAAAAAAAAAALRRAATSENATQHLQVTIGNTCLACLSSTLTPSSARSLLWIVGNTAPADTALQFARLLLECLGAPFTCPSTDPVPLASLGQFVAQGTYIVANSITDALVRLFVRAVAGEAAGNDGNMIRAQIFTAITVIKRFALGHTGVCALVSSCASLSTPPIKATTRTATRSVHCEFDSHLGHLLAPTSPAALAFKARPIKALDRAVAGWADVQVQMGNSVETARLAPAPALTLAAAAPAPAVPPTAPLSFSLLGLAANELGALQNGKSGLADHDAFNAIGTQNTFDLLEGGSSGSVLNETNELERISNIVSLTGMSERIFCEAVVSTTSFSVTVDAICHNRSTEPVSNLRLELTSSNGHRATSQPAHIDGNSSAAVSATLRGDATSLGVLYGAISYESAGRSGVRTIANNTVEIVLKSRDFLTACPTTDEQFAVAWATAGWENRIVVEPARCKFSEPAEIVAACEAAGLSVALPSAQASGCANLRGQSTTGSVALANVCVASTEKGLYGIVRVRSREESLALSTGEALRAALLN